jgi:acetyl-CoA/propionyl-CoA carboxylase biotin carboxyl carrier protein
VFRTVLVANRGEIAVRVIRTLREMGIRSVAVFSDADAAAPHVAAADVAVPIGPAPARESYLDAARLLEAARHTGAEAIHPGYGFLSESADFARRCAASGVVFVGPSPEALDAAGDKAGARRTAEAAGVPVLAGVPPSDDPRALARAARSLTLPVLVKAAAGGGGKGMRRVADWDELAGALESAAREAAAAFGDGRLLIERYVRPARHVEVQVVGDGRGGVAALGERECSLQRRYQKIVEESPSPGIDAGTRERMLDAARRVAAAVRYAGAGTVEFLVDPAGGFHFLEVNARLQVEHPVTELVTGLDLVRIQLEIAAGEPPGLAGLEGRSRGHAVEARLYAEDPAAGFLPTSGRVLRLEWAEGPGLRVDAGIAEGLEVGSHYDPLLAKLLAWAPDREHARRRLLLALEETVLLGLRTNQAFLLDLLGSRGFADGLTYTHSVEEEPQALGLTPGPSPRARGAAGERGRPDAAAPADASPRVPPPALAAAAATFLGVAAGRDGAGAAGAGRSGRSARGGAPAGPWELLGRWRIGETS